MHKFNNDKFIESILCDHQSKDYRKVKSRFDFSGLEKDVCVKWNGPTIKDGYGGFWIRTQKFGRRLIIAHRASYCIYYNISLKNLLACHSCDNRICVNPYHIFPGTNKDNMQDMVLKGRHVIADQSGDKNGNSKLNSKDVARIKKYIDQGMTNVDIGLMFGVSHGTISLIRARKTWKNV